MVSVVMPAYNAEKTVALAVESALGQSFSDLELIIIDDCSTDATYAICEGFAASDERVRTLRNEVNMGAAKSRNRGVAEANGDWIAFLDSDDLWYPDKLRKQMELIADTGAVISYTASEFIDEAGNKFGYTMRAERELTYNKLLRGNIMSCSSVIVRRDVMRGVGFISGRLHEDYAAWLTILRGAGVAYGLDEALLAYRVSGASKSRGRIRSGLMVFRAYLAVGYNAVCAVALTARYTRYSLGKWRRVKRDI